MDNEISIFKESRFGEIRTTGSWMKPMFCLKDVCRSLDLDNSHQVLTRLDPKGVIRIDSLTAGGPQKMTFVNEANLYRCIFASRKDTALDFQNWICDDVLPTIRATGAYSIHKENDRLREENAKLLEYSETSTRAITMQMYANLLSSSTGTEIGRTRLFKLLRSWKYIMPDTTQPYQRYIDTGIFIVRIKEDEPITLVTYKGQVHLARKYRHSLPAPRQYKLF